MSEIVLRRLTHCPTGRIEDQRALEIVLELDDPLPLADQTARTVAVTRMYSRGDLSVLAAHGLKSAGYAALGFADFVVAADGHIESRAYEGATVDLWTRDNPLAPGRKLAMVESWTGIRLKDEATPDSQDKAAAEDLALAGR